jgi:hypothetical protein
MVDLCREGLTHEIRSFQADALGPYLRATGSGDALRTPGNEDALLLRRDEVEETLFELTTPWRSMDAIREFAGRGTPAPCFTPVMISNSYDGMSGSSTSK